MFRSFRYSAFLEGLGSVLNIFPQLSEDEYQPLKLQPPVTLAWQMTGQSLRQAIDIVKNECKPH